MDRATRPIPTGMRAVTPYLTVVPAEAALDFYKRVFGAEEAFRMPGPRPGSVMHAEIRIGDSVIMLADEFPEFGPGHGRAPKSLGGTTSFLYVYVEDVDASVARAEQAGAKILMPAADMFWGDRFAKVEDPFGHQWGLAVHEEDLSPEEITERAKKALGG